MEQATKVREESVTIRVRKLLEGGYVNPADPDCRTFTSADIQKLLNLDKSNAVAAAIHRFVELGAVAVVGRRKRAGCRGKNPFLYKLGGSFEDIITRKNAPNIRGRAYNGRRSAVQQELPLVASAESTINSIRDNIAALNTASAPRATPREILQARDKSLRTKSLLEHALNLAVEVEKYVSEPDLSRVSTEALRAELANRGIFTNKGASYAT
jgi:hypothetical protein